MNMSDPLGYYRIMDLTPSASDAEIKQNYRERAKIWHPDHNKDTNALDKFQKLSVAYDVLQNADSRLFYDMLSQVYGSHNFPDMKSLAIYKDRAGNENPYIRTISQQKVVGYIYKNSFRQDSEICSAAEAPSLVLKASLANWLLGWWGLKAFVKNIQALIYNYNSINQNRAENLNLLIHNAVAYYQDGKKDKACISALQAKEYATSEQRNMLDRFILLTGLNAAKFRFPAWNYPRLKILQLLVPSLLGILFVFSLCSKVVTPEELNKIFEKKNKITYFQTVEFNNGGQTYNDMVISNVMNIPINYNDDSKIFHLREDADIKYGPSDKFDTLVSLKSGHTLRVTGYTPDNKWFRVMVDSGDMGFVSPKLLKQGFGMPCPTNSKVIGR